MRTQLRPTRRLLQLGSVLVLIVFAIQGYAAWQEASSTEVTETVLGATYSADKTGGLVSIVLGILLGLIVAADIILSWRFSQIEVERKLRGSLSLDQWIPVQLTLTSPWRSKVQVEVMDFIPSDCDIEELPKTVDLIPGQQQQFTYRICPRRRGPLGIFECGIRARSWLGLWQITRRLPVVTEAKVYPDFASVEGYQLLAVDHQTSQLGIKRKPRRGEGQNFHQLREYRAGDSLRQIDWKATARQQRLISREYQDERDQQIILLLDSGRRMLTEDGISTHFDQCLNCLLMLSYVALRQGDAVGMMSFGSAVRHAIPVKGANNMNQVINQFYDLYPDKSAPDYLEAAEALLSRYRKRSLIVLATNLRDEDIDDFIEACHLLQRNHVVMVANLRESVLDRILGTPVDNFNQALRYAGTLDYMYQRDKVQTLLKAKGLYVIDSLPQQLTPQLINGYFEIKRAGVL